MFVKEVSSVEVAVELSHEIGSGQTVTVQKFAQTTSRRMESVLFARHQVCMEGFWWCCCRGLVNQAAVDGSVQSGRNLQGGERFPQIALGDARDGFDRIVDDVEVLRRGHERDLVLYFRVRERAESETAQRDWMGSMIFEE